MIARIMRDGTALTNMVEIYALERLGSQYWSIIVGIALRRRIAYVFSMTSMKIIEEIKRLPNAERDRDFDFFRKSVTVRQLAPQELGGLAKELAETEDPAEADRLQARIVRRFYGGQDNA